MKKVLLLVEDNPLLTDIYKSAFEAKGMVVIFAHDGVSGLRLAKERKPDVILLDLLMAGGEDGFAVLKDLKESVGLKNIAVMILTIVDDPRARERAQALGAVDYLIKSNLKVSEVVDRVLKLFSDEK